MDEIQWYVEVLEEDFTGKPETEGMLNSEYVNLEYGECNGAFEAAAAGSTKALNHAFVWDESPHGHDFWSTEYHRGNRDVSDDAKAILNQALERYRAARRSEEQERTVALVSAAMGVG